tara:strand:+ start:822 stop:974 length:153 start_codon:yes stop_codon:yes gene_type:complete
MGAIIGLEVAALVELAAHQGNDPAIMSRLLPAIERGMMAAFANKDGDDGS